MLFLSNDESMFYYFNQSSAFLFIGQPSLHHQARPLTHPPLQWCRAAADTAGFIMCLSVLVCVRSIVHAIHPTAVPEYVLTRSN